jgi:hypothetical protein
MSDNVVSLNGTYSPRSAEPVQSLVEELERLLAAAKSGEIIGFAGVAHHHNAVVSYSYAGAVRGFAMIGGLECVKSRITQRTLKAD